MFRNAESWFRILFGGLLIAVGSVVIYNELTVREVRVFLDISEGKDGFEAASELSQFGSVQSVTPIDEEKGLYEVTFRSTNETALLRWIKKQVWVESAEVRN